MFGLLRLLMKNSSLRQDMNDEPPVDLNFMVSAVMMTAIVCSMVKMATWSTESTESTNPGFRLPVATQPSNEQLLEMMEERYREGE